MYTHHIPKVLMLVCSLVGLMACNQAQNRQDVAVKDQPASEERDRIFVGINGDTLQPVNRSEEAWKETLTEEEFEVLREAGTERAFTGKYWDKKDQGIYTCAGCGLPLFSSETKFKSGTGWPSFYRPLRADHILEKTDNSMGMVRTEVLCARCGGHQGHVFEDGPEPTGLRYCLNSVSLDFVPADETVLEP